MQPTKVRSNIDLRSKIPKKPNEPRQKQQKFNADDYASLGLCKNKSFLNNLTENTAKGLILIRIS